MLMRDKSVLHRMFSVGLYDNNEMMNNLGSRRVMMHRVVMVKHLWELIRVEHEEVRNLACNSV